MYLRPPKATRTDPILPNTTLVRSEPGNTPDQVDPNSLPVFRGMTKADLSRIGEIAGYVLLGLLAMLLVVRPIVRRVLEASRESEDVPPGMLTPAMSGVPKIGRAHV